MAKTGRASLIRQIYKQITTHIKQPTKTNLDNLVVIIMSMIKEMRTSLKMDGKRLNKLVKELLKLLLTNLKPILQTQEM